jgi:predicted kinase
LSTTGSPDSDLKLVVLDQNAISNLAIQPTKAWGEILELLRRGVENGKIICPTASETIAETTHLPRADRKKIRELSDELSQGYYTKFFFDLIAQEILATVRPGVDTFPLWIPTTRKEVSDEESRRSSQAIRKEKEEIELLVNSWERPEKDKSFTIREAQHLAVSNWLGLMRKYLNKFRNDQMIGDEQFVIQQILAKLNELNITDVEISGLLQGIKNESWLDIPLLLCWLFLDGLLIYEYFQRGRKFEYNDETDKYRAATAFHFAHGFITDRGMASMLRQLKFEDPEIFSVFSVSETQKITTFLKSIC